MPMIRRPADAGSWLRLGTMIVVIALVEILSTSVTIPAVRDWYPTLAKPAWNPPNWVFGPVWTTLYAMIAWCGWQLWEQVRRIQPSVWLHPVMAWFVLQMVANFCWSILFFGLHLPRYALADILLLDIAIIGTILAAWRVDRLCAWLLMPYLLWVLYATSLNGGIVWLNP